MNMFTGIVEEVAQISQIVQNQSNKTFTLNCSFVHELKIDQSVSHNGVCLTVESVNADSYTVTAIEETLSITNLAHWKVGDWVNLERSMKLSDRVDGHMVQGHVDQVGYLEKIEDENGSFLLHFSYESLDYFTVKKGSICINGVSLTVVDSEPGKLSVAIIPYTWEHTNLGKLLVGDAVNLEFDILGKYVQQLLKNSQLNP